MLITQHLFLPTLPGKPVDIINGSCKRAAYPGMFNNVIHSKPGFTWHFSMQGLPYRSVATPERRLLPYIFTLTFFSKGGYFLWHCLSPAGRFCDQTGARLFTGAFTLCCPDFPNQLLGSIVRPVVNHIESVDFKPDVFQVSADS